MFKNDKWIAVRFAVASVVMVSLSWAFVLGAVSLWDRHEQKAKDAAAVCGALINNDLDNAKYYALFGADTDASPNRSVRDANVMVLRTARLDVCQPR